jgi:hypothetical protein
MMERCANNVSFHSDAFRAQSTQIFILQMMIKNFLFYGFSQFVNDFVAERGAGHMCRVFGAATLCGFVTCVPMCTSIFSIKTAVHRCRLDLTTKIYVLTSSPDVFGKRNRVWVHAMWAKYLKETTH